VPYEDGGFPIVKYEIQYRVYDLTSSSSIITTIVTVDLWNSLTTPIYTLLVPSNQTNYLITGLTNNLAYIFRIAAINQDIRVGQISGPYEILDYNLPNTDIVVTFNPYTPTPVVIGVVPNAVENVVTTLGDQFVKLTWNPSSIIAVNPVQYYYIDYKINSSLYTTYNQTIVNVDIGAANKSFSTTIGSLTNGIEYIFKIYSLNRVGFTNAADRISVYGIPGKIPDVIALNNGDGINGDAIVGKSNTIDLSWNYTYNGGYQIKNYFIQVNDVSANTFINYAMIRPVADSQLFSSITGGNDTLGLSMTQSIIYYNTYISNITNSYEMQFNTGQLRLYWTYAGTLIEPYVLIDNIVTSNSRTESCANNVNVVAYLNNSSGPLLFNETRVYDGTTNCLGPSIDNSGVVVYDTYDISSVTVGNVISKTDRIFFQISMSKNFFLDSNNVQRYFQMNLKSYTFTPYIQPYLFTFTNASGGRGPKNGFIVSTSNPTTYTTPLFTSPISSFESAKLSLYWNYGGTFVDVSSVYNKTFTMNVHLQMDNASGTTLLNTTLIHQGPTNANHNMDMSSNFDISNVRLIKTLLAPHTAFYFTITLSRVNFSDSSGNIYIDGNGTPHTFTIILKSYTFDRFSHYRFSSGVTGSSTDIGTVYETIPSTLTLPNFYRVYQLSDGKYYNLAVTSNNYFGTAAYSNFVNRRCGRVPYQMGIATIDYVSTFNMYQSKSGQINIYWSPPPTGGYPINSYVIKYVDDLSGYWMTIFDFTPDASNVVFGKFNNLLYASTTPQYQSRSTIITNYTYTSPPSGVDPSGAIVNGRKYYGSISAVNDLGYSDFSPPISVVPGGVPFSIQNPQLIVGDHLALLIWNMPSYDGGYPIIDYLVQYKKTTDIGYTTWHEISNTDPVPPTPIYSTNIDKKVDNANGIVMYVPNTSYYYTTNFLSNEFDLSYIDLTWSYAQWSGSIANVITPPTIADISFTFYLQTRIDDSSGQLVIDSSRNITITASSMSYVTPNGIIYLNYTYRWPFYRKFVTFSNKLHFNMSTSTFGSAPNQFKIELASYSINGASVINTYSGLNTMYTIQVGDQNTPLLNYSESGVRYNFLITPKTVIDYANVDSSGSLINNIALGTVVTSGVTNLIAIPDTVGSQVTLEWTYGNPNLSYDIIVTVDGYEYNPWPLVPGFSYSIATTNLTQDAFGKTQYVINNLRNGQIYYFRVSPLVKIQVGSIVQQFNAPYSNRAIMAPATFPNIPESVGGFGYNGSVTLNWNQPSIDPNGFYNSFNTIKLYYPIIDYEVLYRNVTLDGSWNVYSFSASPSTTRTLTNLTNECTYNFQIATVISTCKSIHTNSVPLYSGSSSTTMQITNVIGFPILNSYSNWEIIINFTPTGGSGWRGIIGNMYDGVQPGGRGWGLWLNPSNVLHWSFASTSYNLTGLGTLVLNRQCRLTLSKTQYELLFTLRSGYNDASGNYIPIFTQHSLSPAGQTMGTGVV
jgi:hypothetical protein